MGLRDDYPYCRDLFESNFLPLFSTAARAALYVKTNNERLVFENLLYNPKRQGRGDGFNTASGLATRDFLASIPAFADFSDAELLILEQKAAVASFSRGEIIFTQGEEGDIFYVIKQGAVDVLIQEKSAALKRGDLGKIVNRLTEGYYFGERALMNSEKRAASIRAIQDTVCLVFSRSVYQEMLSGIKSLISEDQNVDVDWSKDHETRSLFKHVENILDILRMDATPKIKRILYELGTAFTPELSPDEIISRMVITVKIALKVDRVGLFVLSEDRRSMVLKVSERSKGVRLPIRGLAGAVLQENQSLNISDAYQDPRFDATMDRRTGYRTRQVLGVPVRDPISGEAMGLLQVCNKSDRLDATGFSAEQQKVLELAAEQLSELLLGRADVFIQSGSSLAVKTVGQGVGDGASLLNSSELRTAFHLDLFSLHLGRDGIELVNREGIVALEVQVSLHLALTSLCEPRAVMVDGLVKSSYRLRDSAAAARPANSVPRPSDIHGSSSSLSQERLIFDISVRDLPRASRLLFKLFGYRNKRKSTSTATAGRVFLGWAACTVFDFKGCLEALQELKLFAASSETPEVDVPINTTLSNASDKFAALSLVLASDLVLTTDSSTPRIRIVHSLPSRVEPLNGEQRSEAELSPQTRKELDRIAKLSFNPVSVLSPADRDFLWNMRYNIRLEAQLLPAFVMSFSWNNSERVEELYELLDLWSQPSPIQALQLLDRRFMDPKVRAFAVHCLEDLPDEQLSLFMLQLCQQLKFENFVDSALARFLLRRALTNPKLIGHIYFWLLQSEVHNPDVSKRYIVLLQVYLRNCGSHRMELGQQMFVMRRLERVAEAVVKEGNSKEERKSILEKKLQDTVLPATFKLPLNPHFTASSIDVSRCKVMESKKKPLWLTLKNAEGGDDFVLMLKVGDDLRQDALIMQLLRVMDSLWKREGDYDMEMQLYDCISTGPERGLLQVVMRSKTLANILMEATDQSSTTKKSGSLLRKLGSAMKAMGDFSVIENWLRRQIVEECIKEEKAMEEEYKQRVEHFIISTAAYCVASYVLGLGDRHNDNLMITSSGHFFHIDFGHILGHFKSKLGVKRERAPFVFTPAMKAVMQDDQYEAFVNLCCDIYNILRKNAMLLVSLVSLAIPCNLPELRSEENVLWIYDKLMVDCSDEEAAEHFTKQLQISLNTLGTRINDAAHMLAHA